MNIAARNAGIRNFDKFHYAGYKRLYNGDTADDIAERKNLRYREDILDNMCSEELASNLFRITQKLKRDNVFGEEKANETHYEVGKKVRKTIEELGEIMLEDMPMLKKSLKNTKKSRKNSTNLVLFLS